MKDDKSRLFRRVVARVVPAPQRIAAGTGTVGPALTGLDVFRAPVRRRSPSIQAGPGTPRPGNPRLGPRPSIAHAPVDEMSHLLEQDLAVGLVHNDLPDVVAAEVRSEELLVVIWEQPSRSPQPLPDSQIQLRSIAEVVQVPSDEAFADLGRHLIDLVLGFAGFCTNPSVAENGRWGGRIRMPARVLPDTELNLEISALHVKLCFQTDHPLSREIVGRHVDSLEAHVRSAINDDREVEISVW